MKNLLQTAFLFIKNNKSTAIATVIILAIATFIFYSRNSGNGPQAGNNTPPPAPLPTPPFPNIPTGPLMSGAAAPLATPISINFASQTKVPSLA